MPTQVESGEGRAERETLSRTGAALLLAAGMILSTLAGGDVLAQALNPAPPSTTVKLVFVHHSTGENWLRDDYGGLGSALGSNNYFVSDTNYSWGPNAIGDRSDIPDWLEWFDSADTPTAMAALFAESATHSSYTRTLADPGGQNEIIMFKSCFPNSDLTGNPDDPPSADGWLTIGHAKYVYNRILRYFAGHPEKLFVVITAPPLTDATHAANARAFNEWLMNSWLAENHYTLQNVAIFDFYNVLTGLNNHHRYYGGEIQHVFTTGQNTLHYPSADDHPSAAGSQKATNEYGALLNIFYHRWRDSLAGVPRIGGCEMFPANNIWNTRVDGLPVHARSNDWVNSIGRTTAFHMDFGSGTWDGGPIGIPYNLANAVTPTYTLAFDYAGESDPGPYPIPDSPLMEYGSDHHILTVNTSNCRLFEIYHAALASGTWSGGSGAIWDLGSNALRPAGWTSADAAGLPILPGLARYDEIAAGEINHALRFTVENTNGYIWPARHLTADDPGSPQIPPLGARFRLKAAVDISGYPATMQVLLRAMKTYGIILADNGSDWYVGGVPDERWNNDDLHLLDVLTGNDFEAVDSSVLMMDPDSGAVGPGAETCYTLALASDPLGGGDMHANPAPNCSDNVRYTPGTAVELTAVANSGYRFVGWSGDLVGGANPGQIRMNGNRSVTAGFQSVPVLTSPADGTTLHNNRVTFDWEDYPGATGYGFQISRNPGFTSLVQNSRLPAISGYTTASVPAGRRLFWRVLAFVPGGVTRWSGAFSMNTANPPGVPLLRLPAPNALTTDSTPRLDWSAVIVPAGTTFDRYELQVDQDANFSSPVVQEDVAGIGAHEFTIASALDPNAKYSWRVRSWNTAGEFSTWSRVSWFRAAMLPPVLLAPAAGADTLTRRPEFTWNPVAGATGYTLQVSRNHVFSSIIGTFTIATPATRYAPGINLPANSTLYWRLRANGPNGPSLYSVGVRDFATGNPPGVPAPLAPTPNALLTDFTPRLDWTRSTVPSGTVFDHYTVQLDDDPAFGSPEVSGDVNGLGSHEHTLTSGVGANTRFYWRVRSWNQGGEFSGWSAVATFRTALTPPTLVFPVANEVVPGLRPAFDWSDTAGATGYQVQVSRNSAFTRVVSNLTIGSPTSTWTPAAGLPVGSTLFWRVRANGRNGPSAWSATESLRTP